MRIWLSAWLGIALALLGTGCAASTLPWSPSHVTERMNRGLPAVFDQVLRPFGDQQVSRIDMGWGAVCAITPTGALMCAGSSRDGRFGDRRRPLQATTATHPRAPSGRPFSDVVVLSGCICAVDDAGQLFCSGTRCHRGTTEFRPVGPPHPGWTLGSDGSGACFRRDSAVWCVMSAFEPVGSTYEDCVEDAEGVHCGRHVNFRDHTSETPHLQCAVHPDTHVAECAPPTDDTILDARVHQARVTRVPQAGVERLIANPWETCLVLSGDVVCSSREGGVTWPVRLAGHYDVVATFADGTCGWSGGTVECANPDPSFDAYQLRAYILRVVGGDVRAAWNGDGHTCLLREQTLMCGQLGYDARYSHFVALELPEGQQISRLAVSATTACYIDNHRALTCWNFQNESYRSDPPQAVRGGVDDVAVTGNRLCTVESGRVFCVEHDTVRHEIALPCEAQEIAVAGGTTCTRCSDSTLWCWGANNDLQLGDIGAHVHAPRRISRNVSLFGMSDAHLCVWSDDTLRCRGGSAWGQVGR